MEGTWNDRLVRPAIVPNAPNWSILAAPRGKYEFWEDHYYRRAYGRCDCPSSIGRISANNDIPDLSLRRRHRIHRWIFRVRQARPYAGGRQGGDIAEAAGLDGVALFRRRRDAAGHQVRDHLQDRQAPGDDLPADMKKGRNLVVSTLLYLACDA